MLQVVALVLPFSFQPLRHLSASSSLTPQCRATLASNAAKTFAVQSLHSSFIPLLQRCSCFSLFFCNFNHFSFLQLPSTSPIHRPPDSSPTPLTVRVIIHPLRLQPPLPSGDTAVPLLSGSSPLASFTGEIYSHTQASRA